jgi:uncharacterized membrane protein
MTDRFYSIMQISCVLGTGLIAGTFFAFSSFIMSALQRLPAAQGISAMQEINVTVINPLFMSVLFGTAVFCACLGYHAYSAVPEGRNTMILIAALIYIIGTIGTTMIFNVPLNEALAALPAAGADNREFWLNFVRDWTWWNSIRGIAAGLSMVLLALSMR